MTAGRCRRRGKASGALIPIERFAAHLPRRSGARGPEGFGSSVSSTGYSSQYHRDGEQSVVPPPRSSVAPEARRRGRELIRSSRPSFSIWRHSHMAKSTTPRSRRPQPQHEQGSAGDRDRDIRDTQQNEPAAATATEPPPAPPAAAATKTASPTGEDVGSFDAETNAKYEQVKGGKLYIK